jgi:hypothetical protein
MEVKLLKDWANYKKGETVEVEDKDVLERGFEIGLFEKAKEKKQAKTEK